MEQQMKPYYALLRKVDESEDRIERLEKEAKVDYYKEQQLQQEQKRCSELRDKFFKLHYQLS